MSKTNIILAGIKQPARETCPQLSAVLKVFHLQEGTRNNLLLDQEIPLFPWTKIATDLFHFKGDSYSLLVDYTSQFPIIHK